MPRKKTRRKLNVDIQSANELPYPKVRVEWIDCVSDSGWANEKEFDKMKLATPVNEGWLYSKDKNQLSYLLLTIKMKMVLLLGIGR